MVLADVGIDLLCYNYDYSMRLELYEYQVEDSEKIIIREQFVGFRMRSPLVIDNMFYVL